MEWNRPLVCVELLAFTECVRIELGKDSALFAECICALHKFMSWRVDHHSSLPGAGTPGSRAGCRVDGDRSC